MSDIEYKIKDYGWDSYKRFKEEPDWSIVCMRCSHEHPDRGPLFDDKGNYLMIYCENCGLEM